MNTLRVTLFILGNVLFFGQLSRDVHHLIWAVETSVFDEFNPARKQAQSEESFESLFADYRRLRSETDELERSKTKEQLDQLRRDHEKTYDRFYAVRTELNEREKMAHEMRDTWAYSGFGIVLILVGFTLFSRELKWVGIALCIAGFTILEYWASPPLFGGAPVEFRALLWSKTSLTVVALILIYTSMKGVPQPSTSVK